ncbi:hypothetical protein LCGC14_0622260 [marine sediment metagenome]|uniref:Uncharacterized protein n=1 Tax=marine sediment metagenome TaxID=412755 RepID=A0A0F9R4I1_9ZZZZ
MLPGPTQAGFSQERGLSPRDSVKFVTSSTLITTLAMDETMRAVIATMTSGKVLAVTLPKVSLAAGMMYTIYYNDIAGGVTDNLTINDLGDDTDFSTITLNANKERAVLVSDGVRWLTIHAGAPNTG